jgi:hypothetical protein
MLSYIKKIADPNKYRFHIITFEQEKYFITSDEKLKVKSDLEKSGIYWHPRKYHSGSLILLRKILDVIQTFFLLIYLRLFKQVKTIFAFANVAAAFSIIFKKLLGFKMIVYSYEPHSEFLAELNIWNTKSLKYKLLSTLEKKAGMEADFVLTGTKHMVKKLKAAGSKASLHRAPTGINKDLFFPEDSSALKTKYGIQNKKILFYIGKFGDLYYDQEIPLLFKHLKASIPDLFFFVVTPSDLSNVQKSFSDSGVKSSFKIIPSNLTREEVRMHINMADICLSAVPPTPSQKFRSPTKVAEYLLCGKPFITPIGISEDDEYAMTENVGVVLQDFSALEISKKTSEVSTYLSEDKIQQSKRCRDVGIAYRDEDNVLKILSEVLDQID